MHCTEFVPFIAVLGVLVVLCWEKIRKEPLLSGLIGALGLVFVVFVAVMVFDCVEADILKLLGLEEKSEALKFLGIGMGGVLLTLQALASHKRAKAMEDAVLKTEQGQRQERMKNAIEHLGNERDSVRLGGAYELFHLAEDTEDLGQRQTMLDILCAHIRWTTGEPKYREKHQSKPSEEIQSLLNLLFVQKPEVFTERDINLQGSWLNGSNLNEARLEKANLRGAELRGANLMDAQLHRADLSGAELRGANLTRAQLHEAHLTGAELHEAHLTGAELHGAYLTRAQLHEAHLTGAELHGAYLVEAQLHGAYLVDAQLHGAHLTRAQLHGAHLMDAQLHGADLSGAQLHGADLSGAQLHGADLSGAQLHGASCDDLEYPYEPFETVINERIGEESDLSGVISAGGLTREDLASIGKGLPDKDAKRLREKLEAHIGPLKSRVFGLPENSGASIGAYTYEAAAQWIAEYKTATSVVSERG